MDHTKERATPPDNVEAALEERVTMYQVKLQENDQMHWSVNVAAKVFSWCLLAGYLVLPSTFASLSQSSILDGVENKSVLKVVQNPPLLGIACFLCAASAGVLGWLWWEYKESYIWLKNQLVLPLLANSTLGFLSTILNIYTARGGQWSVTAIVTCTIVCFFLCLAAGLFWFYHRKTQALWAQHSWYMQQQQQQPAPRFAYKTKKP